MNEKFYNLPKEKQDRMINGAIKTFALNGYEKASTDIIIQEAGISKGLLFHYFGSKKNLYEYVMEYCARFLMMELSAGISDTEKNLFDRIRLIEEAKIRMLKDYPYLDLFLIETAGEQAVEVEECSSSWHEQVEATYVDLIENKSDADLLRGNLDTKTARDVVTLAMEGYKSRMYRQGMEPIAILKGFLPFLDVFKINFTR